MGLPLYQAPVDSDIKGKAASKSPPTRARSTIRRGNRRNRPELPSSGTSSAQSQSASRWLGRRSALRGSPPTADSQWTPWDTELGDSNSALRRIGLNHPAPGAASRSREHQPVLREVIGRSGPMSQEILAMFGERMARLYAGSSPSPSRSQETTPEIGDQPEGSSAPAARDPLSWTPPTDGRPPSPHSSRPVPRLWRQSSQRPGNMATSGPIRQSPLEDPGRSVPALSERSNRAPMRRGARAGTQLDGLGDRDRSPSPEGDGLWQTLLSSITPDPQPPSVGSSFASTSTSIAASQPASVSIGASSSTSLTDSVAHADAMEALEAAAAAAEESAAEHPCESAGENTDTEALDGDEMGENALTRFPSSLRNHRSYAEVVSHGRRQVDDHLELLEMQRIVRNLAGREEIPDEWWAEAGLSRTLSRQASS